MLFKVIAEREFCLWFPLGIFTGLFQTRGPGLALLSVQFVVGEVFLGVVDRAERKEREGGVIAGS